MMEESLSNLKDHLSWEPKLEGGPVGMGQRIILCGMGGSRLASGFLKMLRPDLDIQIHNNYGLPANKEKALVIVNSYSGNTEEAIGNFHAAKDEALQLAVIASGGKLLELAKEGGFARIELPQGMQPRVAALHSLRAVLKILGDEELLAEMAASAGNLDMEMLKGQARSIAGNISGIPIIYASKRNSYLAEHWKICFNETSKSPAFWNVFPEAGHNEIAGFSSADGFDFIFLRDEGDHPRTSLKMGEFENMLRDRGAAPQNIELSGSVIIQVITSFVLANWASLELAKKMGADPDDSGTIEAFKKKIGINTIY